MRIKYQKFSLTLQAVDPLILPLYKGSTFRGGFGNAFRQVVCALKKKDCKDCLLKTRCVYAYVFETSPAENTEIMGMNKYEKIPHPFIIEPEDDRERIYKPDALLGFNLILLGKAIEYLPYFIYTFEELGKIGIGKGRGKYNLVKIEGIKANDEGERTIVYLSKDKTIKPIKAEELNLPNEIEFGTDKESAIRLKFSSPARIQYKRELTADLEFHILITSLLRRICLINYFHCEGKEPPWDHRQIIAGAGNVSIADNRLKWWDWERYSSRQQTRMKMGGLVGEITYKGNLIPFMPILKAGEILHVGKGTSFGLGKYLCSTAQP